MTQISIPIERLIFGNEHWNADKATNEIEAYCYSMDALQARVDSLEARGKDEEAALINAQAVTSSYALEIAIKSLWAIDNPQDKVEHTHNLLLFFDGLRADTKSALSKIGLDRTALESCSKPFETNRFSMERGHPSAVGGSREFTVYPSSFLGQLAALLRERLEKSRAGMIKPSTDR